MGPEINAELWTCVKAPWDTVALSFSQGKVQGIQRARGNRAVSIISGSFHPSLGMWAFQPGGGSSGLGGKTDTLQLQQKTKKEKKTAREHHLS